MSGKGLGLVVEDTKSSVINLDDFKVDGPIAAGGDAAPSAGEGEGDPLAELASDLGIELGAGGSSDDSPTPTAEPPAPSVDQEALVREAAAAAAAAAAAELAAREQKENDGSDDEDAGSLFDIADPSSIKLTAEEQKLLNGADGVVAKLAQRVALTELKKIVEPLQEEIKALRARDQEFSKSIEGVRALGTDAAIQASVPNLNSLLQDPQFKSALQQSNPVTGRRFADELDAAYAASDVNTASSIVRYIQKNLMPAASPQSAAGALNVPEAIKSNRMPQAQGVTNVTPSSGGGSRLDLRKYEEAIEKFKRGEISQEALQNITNLYTEGGLKGMVSH